MKAWRVERYGEPGKVMALEDVPVPEPGPSQILVRVRATALNFPDVLLCRGQYQVRPDLPFTPGFELCGEVVKVGTPAAGPGLGERVIGRASLPFGALADYALMEAATAFPAPPSLDDAHAAALHVAYQTAWFALHRRANLHAGEVLLVHAAAGGVGSAAVQLGKAVGATVIGVVGTTAKTAVARQLGADVVIDRSKQDFVNVVHEVTNGRGADVIYDPVGGTTYDRSTKCIGFEGRIVVLGFAGGVIQTAALNHALLKNYSIIGLHWGLYESRALATVWTCHDELAQLTAEGLLRPYVSECLTMEQAAERMQRLADGHTTGRIIATSKPPAVEQVLTNPPKVTGREQLNE